MSKMKRRDFLKVTAGLAAGTAAGVPLIGQAQSKGPNFTYRPE